VKPVEVIANPMDKTPLHIPSPDPLEVKPIKWIVITPENAESVFAQLASKRQDVVLFGLTADDYQLLSITMADLRNFIATQRTIIIKYKDYYEPPVLVK